MPEKPMGFRPLGTSFCEAAEQTIWKVGRRKAGKRPMYISYSWAHTAFLIYRLLH